MSARVLPPTLALALAALAGVATANCGVALGLGDLQDAPPLDADAATPSSALGDAGADRAVDARIDAVADSPIDTSDAVADSRADTSDAVADSSANTSSDAGETHDAADATDESDAPIVGSWQIEAYAGGTVCAQGLAVGDGDGPQVNDVATNGTWGTGCDYAVDSPILEIADKSTGSVPQVAFTALDIAIGAGPNGHAWVMTKAGDIYEWTGSFTKRSLSKDLPGVAGLSAYRMNSASQSTIAVGPNNDPWVITNVPFTVPGDDGGLQPSGNYLVAHYETAGTPGAWHWVMKGSNGGAPGLVASQIAVSPTGDVWTISSSPNSSPHSGVVQQWDDKISTPTTYEACATNIAVGADDTPWILSCTGGNGGLQIMKGESHSGAFSAIVNSDGTGSVFGIVLAISPTTGTLWYSDWNGWVHVGRPAQ